MNYFTTLTLILKKEEYESIKRLALQDETGILAHLVKLYEDKNGIVSD